MFHFNVTSGSTTVYDHEGTELADLKSARAEAIRDAWAAMSEAMRKGRDISRHSTIEICDGDGKLLMSLPCSDAILPD